MSQQQSATARLKSKTSVKTPPDDMRKCYREMTKLSSNLDFKELHESTARTNQSAVKQRKMITPKELYQIS